MASCRNGSRDEASLKAAAASLATLKATGIKVTDSSMVMNTELSAALEVEGMISIAEQIASS
jgi:succinate dehydrogenase/fumarate reductase flavoprotein subunit